MKTYLVVMGEGSATVTAASMSASDGFVRFYHGNEDFDPIVVAAFSQHQVISVVEQPPKAIVIEEAPELPKVSRKHPVYAYGKGDLAEALIRVRNAWARGEPATSYLNDILRDLIKGK